MKFVKTQGVVLKVIDTGDADKLILMLSPDHGMITVAAPGAKRTRSKFVGCTEFLCYSQLQLFKSRDQYRLNEGEILESFYPIRNDIVKLTVATYFCEILLDTVMEENIAKRELRLFLNCLHYLSHDLKSHQLIVSIFELRLLAIHGMPPYLASCLSCHKEVNTSVYFSFRDCGLLCSVCREKDPKSLALSTGVYFALRHIVHAKFEKLFQFELDTQIQKELQGLVRRFFKERLEKTYKSLDFLERLTLK